MSPERVVNLAILALLVIATVYVIGQVLAATP